MINKLNCQEITTRLQEIHLKREQYGVAIGERNFSEAFKIQSELIKLVEKLKKELIPVFTIEGKEFPIFSLEIGGKNKERLITELKEGGFEITEEAQEMLDSPEFTTLENPKEISLVRLKIRDLGFDDSATTDQIYARAKELELDLCPAEVGPHQRLKFTEQLTSDWCGITMKQITIMDDKLSIFGLGWSSDGLFLGNIWADTADMWDSGSELMFRLPPESKLGNKK